MRLIALAAALAITTTAASAWDSTPKEIYENPTPEKLICQVGTLENCPVSLRDVRGLIARELLRARNIPRFSEKKGADGVMHLTLDAECQSDDSVGSIFKVRTNTCRAIGDEGFCMVHVAGERFGVGG
jgi:hypothetical protein